MSRIVKKTAHAPYVLKTTDKTYLICMCGLSKNQPFCDGSHGNTLTEEEGKVYEYDEELNRKECQENCCGKCNHDK